MANINQIVSQEMMRRGLNIGSVAGAVGDQVQDEAVKAIFRSLAAAMAASKITSSSGVLQAFSLVLSMLGRYPIAGRLITETVEKLHQSGDLPGHWDFIAHAVVGAGEGLHNALDSGQARPMDIFQRLYEQMPEAKQEEVKATVGMGREDTKKLLDAMKANEEQKRAFDVLYTLLFLDTRLDAVELPGTRDMWSNILLALRMGGVEVLEALPEIKQSHHNHLLALVKVHQELQDLSLDPTAFDTKIRKLRRLQGMAVITYMRFAGFLGTCEAIAKNLGVLDVLASFPDKVSDTLDDLNTFEMRLRAKRALQQGGVWTWDWMKKAAPAMADAGFTSVVWIGWGFFFLNMLWLCFALIGALGFFAVGFGVPVVVLWLSTWAGYGLFSENYLRKQAVAPENEAPAETPTPVEDEKGKTPAETPTPNPVWASVRWANRLGVALGALAWPIFLILSLSYNGWWSEVDHYHFWALTSYMGVLLFLVSFLWAAILIEFSLKLAILFGQGVLTTGGGVFGKTADWFMQEVLKRSDGTAKLTDKLKIPMREATAAERPMMAITQLFSARGGLIAAMLALYVGVTNLSIIIMSWGAVKNNAMDSYLLQRIDGMVALVSPFVILALLLWVLMVMLRVAYAPAFLDDFGGGNFTWKFKKARMYAQLVEYGLTFPVTILIGLISLGTAAAYKAEAVAASYESASVKYAYYESDDCDTRFGGTHEQLVKKTKACKNSACRSATSRAVDEHKKCTNNAERVEELKDVMH